MAVRSPPLTTGDWIYQTVFLVIGIAYLYSVLTTRGSATYPWLAPTLSVSGILFLLAVDLAITNKISVRRIEVDSIGVTFRFLFHNERASWSELSAGPPRITYGGWWVVRSWEDRRGTNRSRAYFVTIPQARAILASPDRPKWVIPEAVSKGLGVSVE